MKLKRYLAAAGMVVLSTCTLFAGENPSSSEAKPNEKMQYWCPVPGEYKKIDLGEGTINQCIVKTNAVCYYLPCPKDSAYAGAIKLNFKPIAIPGGVVIEQGQPFWAQRSQDGVLEVHLVNSMTVEQTESEDGTVIINMTAQ